MQRSKFNIFFGFVFFGKRSITIFAAHCQLRISFCRALWAVSDLLGSNTAIYQQHKQQSEDFNFHASNISQKVNDLRQRLKNGTDIAETKSMVMNFCTYTFFVKTNTI